MKTCNLESGVCPWFTCDTSAGQSCCVADVVTGCMTMCCTTATSEKLENWRLIVISVIGVSVLCTLLYCLHHILHGCSLSSSSVAPMTDESRLAHLKLQERSPTFAWKNGERSIYDDDRIKEVDSTALYAEPFPQPIVSASRSPASLSYTSSNVTLPQQAENEKHTSGEVLNTSISADGRFVLAAASGGAMLYDSETGSPVVSYRGHQGDEHRGAVRTAIFSPSGFQVITASDDNTARLWDMQSGEPLQVFEGHSGPVTKVHVTSDNQQLLTASTDSFAILWDIDTAELLVRYEGHVREVTSIVSNSGTLYTASMDGTARAWDLASGTQTRVFEGHKGGLLSAICSYDQRLLITSSVDATAMIFDTLSGDVVHCLSGHQGALVTAVPSPDNLHVMTASLDGTLRLWSIETGEQLVNCTTTGAAISCADFSPTGKHIITGKADGGADLWHISGTCAVSHDCGAPATCCTFGSKASVTVDEFNGGVPSRTWSAVVGGEDGRLHFLTVTE